MGLLITLNKGLEKVLGLSLVRGQKLKPLPSKGKTKNNLIVEFMGPSGVGKTTLRDYYLKHHKYSFKGKISTEKELQKYDLKFDESDTANQHIYGLLLSKKLEELSNSKDSFIKTNRRSNLFYNTLKLDFFIRNYFSDTQIFLDQHVFKFFASDFINLTETKFKQEFLKNRIIIYCKASPEKIIEYIEKRNKTDEIRPVHQNRDSEILHQQLTEHLTQRNRDVQTLKQEGANILEINTENELSINSELIDNFMTDYFKSQKS